MKTILTIVKRRRVFWGVVGSLLLVTAVYYAVATPRAIQQIREHSAMAREHEELVQEWDHGKPLKRPAVRLAISDIELESGDLRLARIHRPTAVPSSPKIFVEGTTESMDFAFRAYLDEIEEGLEDTGFWYSARGVKGERIKVITASSDGEEHSMFHTVDAVSLSPPPQKDFFSSGRIFKGLPEN